MAHWLHGFKTSCFWLMIKFISVFMMLSSEFLYYHISTSALTSFSDVYRIPERPKRSPLAVSVRCYDCLFSFGNNIQIFIIDLCFVV